LAYLEAAAKNNAVICHKDEGVDGVFDDKEMMFCAEYEDFKGMIYLLIEDKTCRESLSEAAYAKANKFEWENIAHKYTHIYHQCTI
jgi:glycosyltransferase involved in cell wall biosynthesis